MLTPLRPGTGARRSQGRHDPTNDANNLQAVLRQLEKFEPRHLVSGEEIICDRLRSGRRAKGQHSSHGFLGLHGNQGAAARFDFHLAFGQ